MQYLDKVSCQEVVSRERIQALSSFIWLCMNPPFGMFQVWFGSLADSSAFLNQGRALDLGHASVMEHLSESIDAIRETAETLGLQAQARPLIQSFLTPYPRDFAVSIVERNYRTQLK
jgi:hypothetical protein